MPFREILDVLVSSHAPAVEAAVFCDSDGERVDACIGALDPFEVDVIGASMANTARSLSPGQRLRITTDKRVHWLVVVDDGCYLVVCCKQGHDLACQAVFPGVAEALVAYM